MFLPNPFGSPIPKTLDPSVACRPSYHLMVKSEWRLLNALRLGTDPFERVLLVSVLLSLCYP